MSGCDGFWQATWLLWPTDHTCANTVRGSILVAAQVALEGAKL